MHRHGVSRRHDAQARIAERPLGVDELRPLGIEIADALDAAHAEGHHPPRHQAGQHLRHPARPRQDSRLRPGASHSQATAPRPTPLRWPTVHAVDDRPDTCRQRAGDGVVHVAGAGPRRTVGRAHAISSRSASCSTKWRPARCHFARTAGGSPIDASPARRPRRAGGVGAHHRQVPGKRSRPALSARSRNSHRPQRLKRDTDRSGHGHARNQRAAADAPNTRQEYWSPAAVVVLAVSVAAVLPCLSVHDSPTRTRSSSPISPTRRATRCSTGRFARGWRYSLNSRRSSASSPTSASRRRWV